MGFHDHLYPSNYYNEEELLTSDEYPPPLVNLCARFCVNHLSKTLLEKIVPGDVAVKELEPTISTESSASVRTVVASRNSNSGSGSSSSFSDTSPNQEETGEMMVPPSYGFHQQPQYRLRPGVRLPSELSEKIFSYLDKHTTTAELMRCGGESSSSSSSDGSSSSSSEDEGDLDNGGNADDDRDLVLGINAGAAGAVPGERDDEDRAMQEIQNMRRNILRQRRRRRRRRRRRGMVLVNERGDDDPGMARGAPVEFRRGSRAHHQQRRRRRMLWSGGIVDENGKSVCRVGDEDVEVHVVEIIGFDAIVEPLFKDPSNLPLTKLNLRTSTALTDKILATLLAHKPRELDIHECTKLTSASLETINANSQNLVSLTIGTTTQILPTIIFSSDPLDQGFLYCPKLLKLVIWNLSTSMSLYWSKLTACFTNTLTSLDLSGCGEFEDFEFLRKCSRLRSLILYNVLISGKVKDEEDGGGGKKKRKGRLKVDEMDMDLRFDDSSDDEDTDMKGREDVSMMEEESRSRSGSSSNYVVFLKDEEEGQRLLGGVGGGAAAGENGDAQGAAGADDTGPMGYYAMRRRLEKLVNKLVSPICELKELRYLDISTSSDPSTSASLHAPSHGNNLIGSIPCTPWSTYPNPNQVLSAIVQNLPKLTHLDISGTNLAGRGVAVLMQQQEANVGRIPLASVDKRDLNRESSSTTSATSSKLCDIPGLNSRVDNPLEFLGLYGTAHDASHRHCIPARRISGDKDEGQILVACEAYIHRHEVLEKVLNDLFHLFRSEKGTHITKSLRLILRAMNLHPSEKHVQISGSASLFYIVKNEQHSQAAGGNAGATGDEVINPPMKRMILSTIVNAMAIHKKDSTMARNGCLTICHFRIPQDVMFIYAKLVKILLKILGQSIGPNQRHESFVERIAIYLLNSLACQVEGWHKRLVGDLGAMKRMLQLIRDRLSRLECDDVMEIAWSTMWNVTDETPENCEKFLKNDGMVLFLKCLHTFPNKPELLRNMMGLLGNVAEVGALRKQLMTSVFISVFCKLLDSTQDNIEVSYNAAGVLAHMLSDGEEVWGTTSPSRSVIQESMVRNVNRWNIMSSRNINYRSFEPILRLLRVSHTRECQLWATWALANLTRVYPEKYVSLVEKEQGLGPLQDLLDEPLSPASCPSTPIQEDVKKYAKITLQNVEQFNRLGRIDLNSFLDG